MKPLNMILIKMILKYVKDVDVEKIRNNQRIFKLFEKYDENPIFVPFVSDGTVNIFLNNYLGVSNE